MLGGRPQAPARFGGGFFGSLLKTEHMGKPWNNESAEKWWACGRHVRQKELAPSEKTLVSGIIICRGVL